MIKHIPNALTCMNLICGCVGLSIAFNIGFMVDIKDACYLIYIGAIFDFFDGFAARILKVSSPIGKELDSLADMVTFGVLPAAIYFHIMTLGFEEFDYQYEWFLLAPLLIAVFSALRLAKFNVDTRQSSSFIGVPTPANALLISSFPFILEKELLPNWFIHPFALAGLALLLSLLLVSEIPLFALKFKSFGWAENKFKFILIGLSVVFVVFFQMLAIPMIFLSYLLLSFAENKLSKTA